MTNSKPRSEQALLCLFLIISAYMFYGSYSISPYSAARFPRYLAGVLFVLSMVLIVSAYLPVPNWFRPYVEDTGNMLSRKQEGMSEEQMNEEMRETREHTINHKNVYFTMIMVGLYVLIAYLIGMIYATPMFVIMYMLWFGVSRYAIAVITALMTALVYVFGVYLYVPVDEGLLLGFGIGIVPHWRIERSFQGEGTPVISASSLTVSTDDNTVRQ